jgi:hypothetical protein
MTGSLTVPAGQFLVITRVFTFTLARTMVALTFGALAHSTSTIALLADHTSLIRDRLLHTDDSLPELNLNHSLDLTLDRLPGLTTRGATKKTMEKIVQVANIIPEVNLETNLRTPWKPIAISVSAMSSQKLLCLIQPFEVRLGGI